MLYALLCYNHEDVVCGWSEAEDAAVMEKLAAVQDGLRAERKLGPVARLMPTSAAMTLRKDQEPPIIVDGPFAETKEALLGFYILDCVDADEALEIAKRLGEANPGGSYELRPVRMFQPNSAAAG